MPRYFFHIIDGRDMRDEEGTELPDIYVAQSQAIYLTGEVLRDMGARFWDRGGWRLEVENDRAQILFVLHVLAEERSPPHAAF